MIGRILRAYAVEFHRLIRLKTPYLGLVAVWALVIFFPLIHPAARDSGNAYSFVAYALPSTLNLLGVIMVLCFSATLIASEMDSGLIRSVLVRPILRHEYYLAKLLAALTYTFALLLSSAALTWGIAALSGEMNGITYGGELVYTGAEIRNTFLICLGLSCFPFAATASFALLCSVCTRSSSAAVGGAIAGWVLLDALKYPLGFQNFWFSTYHGKAWQVLVDRCDDVPASWLPLALQCTGIPLVFTVLFSFAGMLIMSRRNLY